MAATTLAGGAYEIAATLEETKTALVSGAYKARNTAASMTASGGAVTGGVITITTGL